MNVTEITKQTVVVRGAGDIATGTILRLHRCGFRVVALEVPHPTAIRRTVSFAQAVNQKTTVVEGIVARRCDNIPAVERAFKDGEIPVMVDNLGKNINKLAPLAVVDAILAKRNLGTRIDMAPIVIGLGPGFTAGEDVDAVIETNRGHNLGRVITTGAAQANTGVPGNIGGYTTERVIRAPRAGNIRLIHDIGDHVSVGDILAYVSGEPVIASLNGMLRGIIEEGTTVSKGMKIADIDPRNDAIYCFTVSDKAASISGGVVEALFHLWLQRQSDMKTLSTSPFHITNRTDAFKGCAGLAL